MDVDRVAHRKLVERLWDDVRRREAALSPLPDITQSDLTFSLVLRYLNLHWRVEPVSDPFDQARGGKGRVQSRLAKFVLFVLAPYIQREEEFRAHLVRTLNSTAEAHDQLLREVQVLRAAIDDRTRMMVERTDSLTREFDDRLAALEQRVSDQQTA